MSLDKLIGEENWTTWKHQVQVILEEQELWEVVEKGLNGGEGALEAVKKTKFIAERKKDVTARRIIATSCCQKPIIHILACKTAKEMWEALHEVYEIQDYLSILALNEEFVSAELKVSEKISVYVARVQEMARKLKSYGNPIPDQMLVAVILRGLGCKYRHFRTIWESAPRDERTLKILKARLMIEEGRLEEFSPRENITVFALSAKAETCGGINAERNENDLEFRESKDVEDPKFFDSEGGECATDEPKKTLVVEHVPVLGDEMNGICLEDVHQTELPAVNKKQDTHNDVEGCVYGNQEWASVAEEIDLVSNTTGVVDGHYRAGCFNGPYGRYGMKQVSHYRKMTFRWEDNMLQWKRCRADPCKLGKCVDEDIIVAEREEDLKITTEGVNVKSRLVFDPGIRKVGGRTSSEHNGCLSNVFWKVSGYLC